MICNWFIIVYQNNKGDGANKQPDEIVIHTQPAAKQEKERFE